MNASSTMKHLDGPILGIRVTLGLVQMQADLTRSFVRRKFMVFLTQFSGWQDTLLWMRGSYAGEGNFVLRDIVLTSCYGKLIC